MTNNQIKFLKLIYRHGKTAEELCKGLKIRPDEIDPIGGCYNSLNAYIDYLTSDDENEIEGMFRIEKCKEAIPNHDSYIITSKGKSYIENSTREKKSGRIGIIIGVCAIVVSIIIAIVQKMF